MLRPNSTHLIILSNGRAVAYSPTLHAWVLLSTKWYSTGSSYWETDKVATRTSTASAKGVLTQLETALSDLGRPGDLGLAYAGQQSPMWWAPALSLGHLEMRLHACVMLGVSVVEYRAYLGLYAKRLGAEGFKGKAEELIRELAGPVGGQ